MPSNATTSLRLEKPGVGELLNTWGVHLNTDFDLLDAAIAGFVSIAVTGDHTLTSNNYSTDEARCAGLTFTGTPAAAATITIPAVSKTYWVTNSTNKTLTFSTGSGTTAAVLAGETLSVACDATNCKRVQGTDFGAQRITNVADPTGPQDAATKLYADNLAFTANAGILPGQPGNAGKFLKTDGSVAAWGTVASTDVVGLSASASVVRTGTSTAAALTPGDTYNALTEQVFTFASTITPDFSLFLNGVVNMTGNVTLANPTNVKPGQTGRIRFVQDATGSRTLTVGANWKRSGGTTALTTTPSAVDVMVYDAVSSSYILYDLIRNPS